MRQFGMHPGTLPLSSRGIACPELDVGRYLVFFHVVGGRKHQPRRNQEIFKMQFSESEFPNDKISSLRQSSRFRICTVVLLPQIR